MRTCSNCAKHLPNDAFYPSTRSSRCKKCYAPLRMKRCIQCGNDFEGKPGRKLCSPRCRSGARPQTFKNCESCGQKFGPVSYLAQRFCSYACKVEAQSTGQRSRRITITKARNAQSLLAYHVQAGKITKPDSCRRCGKSDCRIEASHDDYDKPLEVEWLCMSCHRRKDKANPKGVTVKVAV